MNIVEPNSTNASNVLSLIGTCIASMFYHPDPNLRKSAYIFLCTLSSFQGDIIVQKQLNQRLKKSLLHAALYESDYQVLAYIFEVISRLFPDEVDSILLDSSQRRGYSVLTFLHNMSTAIDA